MFEQIYGMGYDFAGLIVPLLALFTFILPLLSKIVKNKSFPGVYTFIISILVCLATTSIYLRVVNTGKPIVYGFGGWPPPIGISYEIDSFNGFLGLYVGWIMVLIVLFSLWYNKNLDEPEWYYTLLLGFFIGVLGCLYTGDVFNLFVMIEVLSISAYGLIAYHKNNPASLEAAIKYGILGATATTIYFIALVIIYGSYSTLNMGHILTLNLALSSTIKTHALGPGYVLASTLAVSLALWVFTFKAGLFPNHFWVPDAYGEAPTPVSAAFSTVSEMVGVYMFIRFLYTVFPALSPLGMYRYVVLEILLILGFIGGVVGALMMFIQRDIKRFLGYSSISHIGLIFMIASINYLPVDDTVLKIAFTAVLAHIVAHGLGKLLLFMSSEVFIEASGSKIMDDMRGIGRYYPWISIAFTIGFLNLMGAIPFLGFFSKLLMYQAFMSIGQVLPAIGIIIVSALSIPGYAKALYSIVFSVPVKEYKALKIGGYKYLLILIGLSLLVLGILFPYLSNILNNIIDSSLTMKGLSLYQQAFEETMRSLWGG